MKISTVNTINFQKKKQAPKKQTSKENGAYFAQQNYKKMDARTIQTDILIKKEIEKLQTKNALEALATTTLGEVELRNFQEYSEKKAKLNKKTFGQKISSIILKIQQKTNTLPKSFKDFAKNFKEEFYPEKVEEDIQSFLIKNPNLRPSNLKKYKENIQKTLQKFEEFNLSEEELLTCAYQDASLFYQEPESLFDAVSNLISLFRTESFDAEKYINLASKFSSIFA